MRLPETFHRQIPQWGRPRAELDAVGYMAFWEALVARRWTTLAAGDSSGRLEAQSFRIHVGYVENAYECML